MALIIITTGILSVILQFVLVRELQITFLGNELSLGIILFLWLAGESLGSFTASRFLKNDKKTFYIILLLNNCLLFTGLFLSRAMKSSLSLNLFEILQPQQILIISAAAILPLAFIAGALFAAAIKIINAPVKVYILEAAGAFIAGALCLTLPLHFNNTQIIFFASCLILIVVLIALLKDRFKILSILSLLLLGLNLFLFTFGGINKLHNFSSAIRFKPQELLFSRDSIYANTAITKSASTYSLYENGKLYFTTEDTAGLEEFAAMVMLSHPAPGRVLLIGSGASGLIAQILKFPVDSIDYLELDPKLIESSLKYIPAAKGYGLDNPKVKIINQDARFFIRNSPPGKYDMVILNLGDPYSLQLNRFYTLEFFNSVKKAINNAGIFCVSISSKEDVLEQNMLKYNRSIYKTARQIFISVEIIPGERIILLCCDDPLFSLKTEIMEKRFINNKISDEFFTLYHIKQKLFRKEYVTEKLEAGLMNTAINSDYYPWGFFYYLGLWGKASSLNFSKIWAAIQGVKLEYILIFILAVFLLLRKKAINIAIFTTGLSAIAIQIMTGLIFQINYGYLYYQLGFLIGLFMFGLALGALSGKLTKQNKSALINLEITFCVILFITPLILKESNIIYFLLTLLTGFLAGYEFSIFCALKNAAIVYALDLAGACLGSLLVTLALIPVFGIYKACFILGAIKLIGILFLKKQLRCK